MADAGISTVCLVYPTALVVAYTASHLIVRLWTRADWAPRRVHTVLSSLSLLCLSLLSSIVLSIVGIATRDADGRWWESQPYLAHQVAVLFFFLASILPDPEQPYRPSPASGIVWLLATGFETALAVWQARTVLALTALDLLDIVSLCLAATRVLCLSLGVVFLYLSAPKQSLLTGDEVRYGTIPSPPDTTSPPETDWVDYVINFVKVFRLIWPSESPALQLRAVVCLLLLAVQRVVNVLVPLQLGVIVRSLAPGSLPVQAIVWYAALRALQGEQGVIGCVRAHLWIPIGQATYRQLSAAAFAHVLSLSLDFHLGKRLGEVMSALTKGAALNTFLVTLLFTLFPMLADLGVAAAYLLATFDPFYCLIVIAMGWAYIFTTIYLSKFRARARREMTACDREMDAVKADGLISYEVVHYNDAVAAELARFADRVSFYQRAEYVVMRLLNLLNAAQNVIFTLGVALTCLLSAYNVAGGRETIAVFVTLISYLTQLQAPLNFFGSCYTQMQNNLVDAERMLALFDEEPTVVDAPDAVDLVDCQGALELRDVSFSYDGRRTVLHNITLTVAPGTSLAVVGETGSGKSSLLRLLFRFYNVSAGQILLDGTPVEQLTIQSLRSHIGVVPQETMLFNDTLLYNIRYARPSATDDQVYAACKAASLHDKILAFPDGYLTQVGERGLRLSGGEKQRLSIARAILKAPQIIFMDEATSSLDSATEQAIQASLADVSRGRTTITIAHRLSTIVHCDKIVVLQQGRIVETGTHSELLRREGQYKQMWEKQSM
ncbi:hypothetical protein ASPZODRAFT_143816 [Penicilliopsis zonata CBS 506.65]|uniref:ABC transporter domain-containing protein n=1 Tax=Penicilliopsis zonata CBS 506.65 TaxID=1073090 RepID=A0A1L9SFZ8_9EURO|nr:hypothetical protein ASPZODRAFT_143816 [Penicilliopsis zonata CBS 506.65]OJJ45954.1 hypothetical protein ASPZODRAFT_143816 [Penicilliopsis zonata CBS 506.65]